MVNDTSFRSLCRPVIPARGSYTFWFTDSWLHFLHTNALRGRTWIHSKNQSRSIAIKFPTKLSYPRLKFSLTKRSRLLRAEFLNDSTCSCIVFWIENALWWKASNVRYSHHSIPFMQLGPMELLDILRRIHLGLKTYQSSPTSKNCISWTSSLHVKVWSYAPAQLCCCSPPTRCSFSNILNYQRS
jgi:hypothetical protein